MSSSPTVQLDAGALDALGMSVATAPLSSTNTRAGSIYEPTTWAAAAPVWFHPAGPVLMLAARRWSAAVPAGGTPGSYSTVTEDTVPSWAAISALTGQRSAVPGQPVNLPMNTVATGVTLAGAASRPPGILFVLSTATVAGTATAVLQRFNVGLNGSVVLAFEEVLPTPNGVVFGAGLQFDGQSLIVYGTDSSHQVYKMTKPFGQVGINSVRTVTATKYIAGDTVGSPRGWQYFTGTGYAADPAGLSPMTVTTNTTVLTTHGPMSFGSFRNQTFMTTVNLSGTTYSGQFWRSRSGLPFESISAPVALGDSGAGTSLGGGIYLQPQLAPNPLAAPMTSPGVLAGIPYVTWTKLTAGSGHVLDVVWGILAVTA